MYIPSILHIFVFTWRWPSWPKHVMNNTYLYCITTMGCTELGLNLLFLHFPSFFLVSYHRLSLREASNIPGWVHPCKSLYTSYIYSNWVWKFVMTCCAIIYIWSNLVSGIFPNLTLAVSDNNKLMNIDMLWHNVGYLDVAALWLDLFISSDSQCPHHYDHKKACWPQMPILEWDMANINTVNNFFVDGDGRRDGWVDG